MKYVAAGVTAIVVFFMSGLVLDFIEEPVRNLVGWQALDPALDMRWWRAGAGLTLAACMFRLVVNRRNNAALRWRKTLVARART